MSISDELKKIMEGSKAEVVRLFFKNAEAKKLGETVESEVRKVFKKEGLTYNLYTLKAMKEGMDMCSAGLGMKSGKQVMDAGIETAYVSIIAIEYLILLEEDKLKEVVDNSLKDNLK